MQKCGFTLVEIVVVLIVIGILISLVPYRLQGLENHVQLSLVTQKIEDTWDSVSIRMRQGSSYSSTTLSLGNSGWNIHYSGGTQPEKIENILFEKKIQVFIQQGNEYILQEDKPLQWVIGAYSIACTGPDTIFKISYEGMKACYKPHLDSCMLQRVKCK